MSRLLGHRYLRRLVTIPAVWLAFLLLTTSLPLSALVGAAMSPWVPGKWRPLRLLWFLFVYLLLEVTGMVAAGALWIATGFGSRVQRLDVREVHYRLLGSVLGILVRTAHRTFRLQLDVAAPPLPDTEPEVEREPRPLLVFSRHAGPGDSFLLVHELISVYGRRPRIVLKNTLQWDPMIDLLLNRLPTQFISGKPGSPGVTDSIEVLAADMSGQDALVIFPEGGNYTEGRRVRGIERLEAVGETELARRARNMLYLLPPRPGGAFAAIDGAPGADVVFVAHTGLEDLSTLRDLWNGLPMDASVLVQFWVVPADDVPDERDARMTWLYGWWEQMNQWVDANND